MPASKQIAVLSVRLPASELRRFKSLAASRGVSLQQAVHEALRAWASRSKPADLLPLDQLRGSLAGFDALKFMHADREAELAKDKARMR
jgi:hypothetical protein